MTMMTGQLFCADDPIMVVLELTDEQKQELIEAPASLLDFRRYTLTDRALELQQVEKIRAETWGDSADIQGWIDYAPIRLSETRRFQPRVLCVKGGIAMVWSHCQDESYSVVELPKQNIIVSEEVSNEKLQDILAFVQVAGLKSPKNMPISSENIFRVVHYFASKKFGVFATTLAGEYATIVIQPVSRDGQETYEITDFACNSASNKTLQPTVGSGS
jgi:hypothetical protein